MPTSLQHSGACVSSGLPLAPATTSEQPELSANISPAELLPWVLEPSQLYLHW